MSVAFLNPYLVFALVVGMWAVWRVGCWLGSGGRLPLRGKRGTAAAFSGAALAAQAMYQPGVRAMIEQQAEQEQQRDDDEEGDGVDGENARRRGTRSDGRGRRRPRR